MNDYNCENIFNDHKGYTSNSKALKKLIFDSQLQPTMACITHIKTVLNSSTVPPTSKLLALRFIKECVQSLSYMFIKLIQTELATEIQNIALYNKESTNQNRGKSMFVTKNSTQNQNQLEQTGMSVLKICLQFIKCTAQLFPFAVYQYYEFPSTFALKYQTLIKQNVTFPIQFTYFKPSQLQRIRKSYSQNNSQDHRGDQVEKFLTAFISKLKQQQNSCYSNPYYLILKRILATGDSNFIEEAFQRYINEFDHTINCSALIVFIRIFNELFLIAEIEVLFKIKDCVLHRIANTLYFNIQLDEEHKILRRFCYETMKMWNYVVRKHKVEQSAVFGRYIEVLEQPQVYHFFNTELFQTQFLENLQKNSQLNLAKRQFIEADVNHNTFQKLNTHFAMNMDKIQSEQFLQRLQIQYAVIEKIPKIASVSSKSSYIQSFSQSNSSLVSKNSEALKLSLKQKPLQASNSSRGFHKKGISLNLNNYYTPRSSGTNFKSPRINSKASILEAPTDRNENAKEKKYEKNENNKNQESLIIEPTIQPMQKSYHANQELQKQLFRKLRNTTNPSFKDVTESKKFIIMNKQTRDNKLKINQDMKILRNIQQFNSKSKLNVYQQNLPNNSPNHTSISIDEHLDKRTNFSRTIQEINKQMQNRIGQLQKKLHESLNRQRTQLQIIRKKDQQLAQLKEQLFSVKQSISSNEYLVMQNETLKHRLNKNHEQKSKFMVESTSITKKQKQPKGKLIENKGNQYQIKFRKSILKTKQLLIKSDFMQIGIITSLQQQYLKINLFVTFEFKVTNFSCTVISPDIKFETGQSIARIIEPQKQEKLFILFYFPNQFRFKNPKLILKFNNKQQRIDLPITLFKFVKIEAVLDVPQFKKQFKRNSNIFVTDQIFVCKKLIRDLKSLSQYIPRITCLNPDKQQLFYQGIKNMKFGFIAQFQQSVYNLRLVMTSVSTLYLQCSVPPNSKNSTKFVQEYLNQLLAIFSKEKPTINGTTK